MNKKPKISILLPCYKSEDLLQKVFLPSFFKNTKEDVELILYDNGGNNLDYLSAELQSKGIHNVKVVGNGENVGLNPALNKCAKFAVGDWYYLPHTDMHLMPGWDTALLEATKNQPPGFQLLCSRSIEKHSHIPTQLLKDFGTNIENFKEKELYDFFESYSNKGIVTSYRMPFFMHKNLWKKMEKFNKESGFGEGGVDSSLFSYATDNDLFFTAYHVGVRQFWMVNSSVVYHLSGHSNNQQSVDKDSQKPYIYLLDKWRGFGYHVDMNIDESEQRLIPWGIKIR